jgi:hypothetical protein
LAIAVDNLATAQELTQEQEEAEQLAREEKENHVAKEVTMFLPTPSTAAEMTVPKLVVSSTGTDSKPSIGQQCVKIPSFLTKFKSRAI